MVKSQSENKKQRGKKRRKKKDKGAKREKYSCMHTLRNIKKKWMPTSRERSYTSLAALLAKLRQVPMDREHMCLIFEVVYTFPGDWEWNPWLMQVSMCCTYICMYVCIPS